MLTIRTGIAQLVYDINIIFVHPPTLTGPCTRRNSRPYTIDFTLFQKIPYHYNVNTTGKLNCDYFTIFFVLNVALTAIPAPAQMKHIQ